jgi:nucleoside 2-deoxyribosyltransferase
MKSMTIYLAGPIDGINTQEAQGWRRRVASSAPTGVLFFDPSRAWWGATPATAAAVDHGNRIQIMSCDGVLANLSGPGRGFGSVREIEFARLHGKPVAVVSREPLVSLTAHDLFLHTDIEAALMELLQAVRDEQDAPRVSGMMIRLLGQQETDESD